MEEPDEGSARARGFIGKLREAIGLGSGEMMPEDGRMRDTEYMDTDLFNYATEDMAFHGEYVTKIPRRALNQGYPSRNTRNTTRERMSVASSSSGRNSWSPSCDLKDTRAASPSPYECDDMSCLDSNGTTRRSSSLLKCELSQEEQQDKSQADCADSDLDLLNLSSLEPSTSRQKRATRTKTSNQGGHARAMPSEAPDGHVPWWKRTTASRSPKGGHACTDDVSTMCSTVTAQTAQTASKSTEREDSVFTMSSNDSGSSWTCKAGSSSSNEHGSASEVTLSASAAQCSPLFAPVDSPPAPVEEDIFLDAEQGSEVDFSMASSLEASLQQGSAETNETIEDCLANWQQASATPALTPVHPIRPPPGKRPAMIPMTKQLARRLVVSQSSPMPPATSIDTQGK